MKKCESCNIIYEDRYMFCQECGKSLIVATTSKCNAPMNYFNECNTESVDASSDVNDVIAKQQAVINSMIEQQNKLMENNKKLAMANQTMENTKASQSEFKVRNKLSITAAITSLLLIFGVPIISDNFINGLSLNYVSKLINYYRQIDMVSEDAKIMSYIGSVSFFLLIVLCVFNGIGAFVKVDKLRVAVALAFLLSYGCALFAFMDGGVSGGERLLSIGNVLVIVTLILSFKSTNAYDNSSSGTNDIQHVEQWMCSSCNTWNSGYICIVCGHERDGM